jgi:hypothetical protein
VETTEVATEVVRLVDEMVVVVVLAGAVTVVALKAPMHEQALE